MSTSEHEDEAATTPPSRRAVVLLLSTIGSTTWRMFVPTIGLTVLGVIGDNTFSTKPWLTITGIILGIAFAAVLVGRQFKGVK